jgi:hypothetical protein
LGCLMLRLRRYTLTISFRCTYRQIAPQFTPLVMITDKLTQTILTAFLDSCLSQAQSYKSL